MALTPKTRRCRVREQGPVDRPRGWVARVNAALTEKEQDGLRACVARGRPYGDDTWQRRMAARLGLEHTVRSEGRPASRKDTQRAKGAS